MSTRRFTKDPDAVKDYRWDWTKWLADGEAITTATVSVPTVDGAPVRDSTAHDGSTVTVWLSGGTPSMTSHSIGCHIITDQGRQDDRTIYVKIAQS